MPPVRLGAEGGAAGGPPEPRALPLSYRPQAAAGPTTHPAPLRGRVGADAIRPARPASRFAGRSELPPADNRLFRPAPPLPITTLGPAALSGGAVGYPPAGRPRASRLRLGVAGPAYATSRPVRDRTAPRACARRGGGPVSRQNSWLARRMSGDVWGRISTPRRSSGTCGALRQVRAGTKPWAPTGRTPMTRPPGVVPGRLSSRLDRP